MLNRRWLTARRLLKSGEFKELFVRSIKVFLDFISKETQIDYLVWRERWVDLKEEEERRIVEEIDLLSENPSFKILLNADSVDPISLFSTIRSVKSQIYPNWMLEISNLHELDSNVSREIFSMTDDRIAFSESLEPSIEEWIIELDAGVSLHKTALADVAFSIVNDSEIQLVYGDHDHVDNSGIFLDPHMKPVWNAELFSAINYMAPFVICEKGIWNDYRTINADQHDFLLEVTKNISSETIHHIPRILSTVHITDKSSHLDPPIKKTPKTFRSPEPLVSVLIPTHNKGKILEKCLESLFSLTDYSRFEVILVDHETDENKALKVIECFQDKENFNVVNFSGSFNFSAIMNRAAKAATGDILVLLNNDTEIVEPEWLKEIVFRLSDPEIGIVGALLLFGDGTIQHAGIHPGVDGLMGHGHKHKSGDSSGYFNRLLAVHEVAAVTGACLAIEKPTWKALGGLDEKNLPVAYNDVDLCLKAREAGLKVILNPFVKVIHHESVSRGVDDDPKRNERLNKELSIMKQRWKEKLNFDPAYSPNLNFVEGGFELAEKPRYIPRWKT